MMLSSMFTRTLRKIQTLILRQKSFIDVTYFFSHPGGMALVGLQVIPFITALLVLYSSVILYILPFFVFYLVYTPLYQRKFHVS